MFGPAHLALVFGSVQPLRCVSGPVVADRLCRSKGRTSGSATASDSVQQAEANVLVAAGMTGGVFSGLTSERFSDITVCCGDGYGPLSH